jgi:hypothetical protein
VCSLEWRGKKTVSEDILVWKRWISKTTDAMRFHPLSSLPLYLSISLSLYLCIYLSISLSMSQMTSPQTLHAQRRVDRANDGLNALLEDVANADLKEASRRRPRRKAPRRGLGEGSRGGERECGRRVRGRRGLVRGRRKPSDLGIVERRIGKGGTIWVSALGSGYRGTWAVLRRIGAIGSGCRGEVRRRSTVPICIRLRE